ncbi:MAG TPA: LacI family DNA-binding transcriptional regulator [Propionibacteriaceae bacterium]|nr:LacI family DNA-binding transcriptional regulator [Propionibacteriaceae bacterium]
MVRNPSGTAARGAVTRADVARYAGVSDAVVSFVVNGGPKSVSEPTAERVRDAIRQLGYRPNSTARALALGTTKTLGMVVPDSTNPFYAEFTVAIQRAAAKLGYALLTISSGFDPAVELRGMLELCDRQIDGLLVARGTGTSGAGELARRGVRTPVVLIDSATVYPGYTTIGPDAAAGIGAVVEHLLRVHDHRSVSLIIGDTVDADTDGRESGWLMAHARNRRSPGVVESAPFTRVGGYDAGLRLLQRPDRPRALVTGSDLQAVGLLRATRELGLRVPEDVALASFDGTEEATFTWPALTTSRQPIDAMADAAVTAVLAPEPPTGHQVFATDLVIGGSCGC